MNFYNVKYQAEFNSIGTNQNYKFEVLEKNYTGPFYSLTCAANPVIHSWGTDDPKPAVKGGSLTFNYINEGANPLASFYSNDDTKYKGRLWWGNQLMFEGFLVQDDSSELLVDYIHEVTLSFNDGLGLLKDIALNLAYKTGLNDFITTDEDIVTNNYRNLWDIIQHCVYCTGLQLPVNLYENLHENDQIGDMIFPHLTEVNIEVFLNGETWDDCYTVLEKILTEYGMSLFQSNGVWNIIRWHEMRYYLGAVPGYSYDNAWQLQGPITLDNTLSFGAPFPSVTPGNTNNAINGFQNRILRPFKYTKHTLNYKLPTQFKNSNLLILGRLLRQYTQGTGSALLNIYEYESPFWIVHSFLNQTVFIRVTKDNIDFEIERFLVVKGQAAIPYTAAVSSAIEVDQGDDIIVTANVRAFTSFTNTYFALAVRNTYPTTFSKFANGTDGTGGSDPWQNSASWLYHDSPNGQWFGISIAPTHIPNDGLIEFYLASMTSGTDPNQETHYRDIRIEYKAKINESTTTIGHYHKDEQTEVIKNNEDIEVFIDDTPKNAIYSSTFNVGQNIGLIHKRTQLWHRGHISPTVEATRVGHIITNEQEFWRLKPRTILEGTVNGIYDGINHASMLTRYTNDQIPNYNFIFGKCSIDYRNNEWTGTLWEMYRDNEQYIDLAGDYSFQYIYKV